MKKTVSRSEVWLAVQREASEKARLEVEEQERQKAAKEKVEREAAKKAAREKAKRDATEKALLEVEEKAKQKAAREKLEREAAEKAAREKAMRESAEKRKRERKKSEAIVVSKPTRKPETLSTQNNSGTQIILWIIGFATIIFIIWFSTLNNTPLLPGLPEYTKTPTTAYEDYLATQTAFGLGTREPTLISTLSYSDYPATQTAFALGTKMPTSTLTITPTIISTLTLSSTPTLNFTFTPSSTQTEAVISSITYCSWGRELSGGISVYECGCISGSCACTLYSYSKKTDYQNDKQSYTYKDDRSYTLLYVKGQVKEYKGSCSGN